MKRKGFTLIELMTVVTVIAILSSGMMLSSGPVTDSAKAATLVADLRTSKAAGVMWLVDNIELPFADIMTKWNGLNADKTPFENYLDNRDKVGGLLFVTVTDSNGTAFLIGRKESDRKVLEKAINQAYGVLCRANGTQPVEPDDGEVYVRVR